MVQSNIDLCLVGFRESENRKGTVEEGQVVIVLIVLRVE